MDMKMAKGTFQEGGKSEWERTRTRTGNSKQKHRVRACLLGEKHVGWEERGKGEGDTKGQVGETNYITSHRGSVEPV